MRSLVRILRKVTQQIAAWKKISVDLFSPDRIMQTPKFHVLVAGILLTVDYANAQTWTPTTTFSNSWGCIAASADGAKLVASSLDGIYISTNSGNAWTQTSLLVTNVSSLASSWDGTKLVAAGFRASPGFIFTSEDSGITWNQTTAPHTNWYSVASSANGSNLVAVGYNLIGGYTKGFVFVSTNAGTTWNPGNLPNVSSLPLFSVAASADGSRFAAAALSGTVYTSTNSGFNWMASSLFNDWWVSVVISANGTELAAASQIDYKAKGYICVSKDFGMTWVTNILSVKNWQSLACSADGSVLMAVAGGFSNYVNQSFQLISVPTPGPIFSSSDFGVTWTSNAAPSSLWQSVAMSADGKKQYAIEDSDGEIYDMQKTPGPNLNIGAINSGLALSWTIPSTNFLLQQSSDLISWTDVTNPPVLNLTNLQNEVTLTPSNNSSF